MNRFRAFILKEYRHLLRDTRSMVVLFCIPVIQLLLFGYVITTEINSAKIGILDNSKDDVTIELTNKLLSSGYFILQQEIKHFDQIEKAFKKGKLKEVIVFEHNFGRKLEKEKRAYLQIITDASDPNTAQLLESYTQNIVITFMKEYNKEFSQTELIATPFRMYYNEDLRSSSNFVPGTMALILMLISALMTSISIAREKELGTMEVLLISPLKPIQIVVGKVIPYFTLSIINTIVILGIGYYVFDVPIRGSVILLFAVCLLFIFLALSLGVLISTIANSQQVAMIISLLGLMLPTILLSGFIFPIENMPVVLQLLSLIMPPRWFLEAIRGIMLKGADITMIWHNILILFGMLIFFITLSVRKFKIRLE